MQIVETDRGFEIRFQWDPKKLAAVKSIQGSYWRQRDKTWVVPGYRKREIETLKKLYGIMLDPLIDLPEQLGAIPALPNLDVQIPLARPLYPFQAPGVAYNRLFKRTIIGDDPGLGKTTQAIATVMSFGLDLDNMLKAGPGLVICPNTLCLTWVQEWIDVAGRRSMVLDDTVIKNWQSFYKSGYLDVFIISYDAIRRFFVYDKFKKPAKGATDENGKPIRLNTKDIPFKESIDLFKWLIIDESHNCKGTDTLRTKFVTGLAKKKEIIMELTGTPVVNRPDDLLAQLVIINRLKDVVAHLPQPRDENGKLTDWFGVDRFLMRYCSKDEKGNYLNQRELNYRLKKTCFYRRQKAEVLTDLPEKVRQIILCDITNRTEYKKAHSDMRDYLTNFLNRTEKEVRKSMKAEMLIRIGILKQISARGKIEAAKEAINEVVESGQKIVIFCYLKEIVQELKNIYPSAVSVVGDDSLELRQANIIAFQTKPNVNIIICNIKTGGVGITLTAASEVLFIEFPWHEANCGQCEDRTHRIGQKESVRARYLLGENTIDRWCYQLIQRKRSIANTITGDEYEIAEEVIDDLINLFNQK